MFEALALLGAGFIFLILALIWEMIWKGIALWYAARNDHLGWYVAILVVNSLGILPMIYLILYAKKKQTAKKRK